ncbi:MAG TPA: hypothetical protein DCR40_16360 [Prolixibacteraceae bacterium]|nr:hypothetical protein [Prolixibacteraceae bacterium]
MKKIILFLLIVMPFFSFAQNEKVTWDYPIKPGSKEWLAVSDFSKRLELLNIPAPLLKKMSTEELVKSCLNYPEYRLIFTRNDLQSGYNFIRSSFNGFVELESRPDAGKELVKVYAGYKPDGFDLNATDLEIGNFICKITYIEILMAQTEILNKLNPADSKELMTMCSQKYKVKKDRQKYYGGIGLQTTALIIARQQSKKLINAKIKHGDQKINAFINSLTFDDIGLLDDLVMENDKILSDGL